VDRDAKRMLKCKNWIRLGEDRDVWRQRIEEAKGLVGLWPHKKRRNFVYKTKCVCQTQINVLYKEEKNQQ
jgi:hypothetical protein